MNKTYFSILVLVLGFVMISCDKDDKKEEVDYAYHAHIHSPNTDAKHVNDELVINVNFESHTGETIHHVNIKIYNKADNTVVYNKPNDAHVGQSSGDFTFEDTFILSNENGVEAHSNWILEAKVWGSSEEEGEVVDTLEFHVHPE
jgi:hypothetical protein